MPWPNVSLGELIRLERRQVEVVADKEYQEIGIYCFGRGIFHKMPRSGLEVGGKNLYELRAGDLILQVTFAWEGAIALCSIKENGLYGSTRYPTFRVDEERCFPPFLVRYLCTRDGLEQINKICPGSAGRNRVLSIKRIPEVAIPLPSLPEQRRIVARIESLAAEIEEARELREQIVEETQLVIRSAQHQVFFNVLGQYGGESLGSLISMSSGEQLNSGDMDDSFQFPVYGGGGFAGRYTRYLFDQPKIAIGRVGARCGCVFSTEAKSWITDNALYLREYSNRLDPNYLVYALRNLDLRQRANQAAQPVVSQKGINPMQIPVPPLPEQRRIVDYLDGLQAKVDVLKKLQAETAAELAALLPSILDKAFKGEL